MKTKEPMPRPEKGSVEYLTQRSKTARGNLVLTLVFTGVNVLLLLIQGFENANYFLFSLWFPYTKFLEAFLYGAYIPLISAGVMLAALILCVIFWSKSKWTSAVSLVFVILDCLYLGWWILIYSNASTMILDILFHLWVLYAAILGCTASFSLAKKTAAQPQGPEL